MRKSSTGVTPKSGKSQDIIKHQPKKTQKQRSKAIQLSLHKAERLRRAAVREISFSKGQNYAGFCVAILAATTIIWALLATKIHASNADQLVNAYLFENMKTFQGAGFPVAHSFLIKWPLFLLIKQFHYSVIAIQSITVAVSALSVAIFSYILYRIDKRPLVFGTLSVALASVLLLVPAQPYAGAILPVSMAMLATRNLEYIMYIGALILMIRAVRIKSWSFAAGTILMLLLVASDRLFLFLSLGGAMAALVSYMVLHRRRPIRLTLKWLFMTILAAAGGTVLLWAINASTLTHIVGQSDAGPFGVINSAKSLALALIFGALNILTNFGANPVFDVLVLRKMPAVLQSRLLSAAGFAFMVNGLILITGAWAVFKVAKSHLRPSRTQPAPTDAGTKLALVMIWSSLAAFGLFVVTDHYYPVDARYLNIMLFTVFIALAVYLRTKEFSSTRWPIVIGLILGISVLSGLVFAVRNNEAEQQALVDVNQRDYLVSQTLLQHHVDVLVGDYWRVIPIKAATRGTQAVMPLDGCNIDRQVLSSESWRYDLNKHSFAYLLSFDKSLTNYPKCTLDEIVKRHGRPNSSVLIAGKRDAPKEVVLFYDFGAHRSDTSVTASGPQTSTVLPVAVDQLPKPVCKKGTTILNIVAHEDDDLLFLNPDLMHDISAKNCVRTVYLTAGDAGSNQLYWLARERGSEMAYSQMIGTPSVWIDKIVKLSDHQFVTIANPRGNTDVSLIFMRLPDGNVRGGGFKDNNYESLERLSAGQVGSMHSVESQSSYTSAELETTLQAFMKLYNPSEIHTQAPRNFSERYHDHSDHLAAGHFAQQALVKYQADQQPDSPVLPIKFYIGYPIRDRQENISLSDFEAKEKVFLNYGAFDGAVCGSVSLCNSDPWYGSFLRRQYSYQ